MPEIFDTLQSRVLTQKIPVAAHIDLTFRCHQNCIHCYLPGVQRRPGGNGPAPELGIHEVKQILDQLAAMGTLLISFSGGEIFMRSDLFDILSYARQLHFMVYLLTTGTLGLDERAADRLVDLGILDIDLSFYSCNPAIHETITRTPGSYQKLHHTIELLTARNLRVRLKHLVMKPNQDSLAEVVALAESRNLEFSFDTLLSRQFDGDPAPQVLMVDQGGQRRLCEYIFQRDQESSPARQPSSTSKVRLPPDPGSEPPCGAGHTVLYISPYGEVRPCIEIPLVGGQVRQQSLKNIWEHSPVFQQIRSIRRRDLQDCSECPTPGTCNRCIGLSLQETGDLLAPAAIECQRNRLWHLFDQQLHQS